jgi:hypothetical protein
MKLQYHRAITRQALEEQVSPAALEAIMAANLGQDALRYQFGHDHFHYDSNSFPAGDAYIEEERHSIADALARGEALSARQAFGRLIHTAQDFYAHSNYVALWRERNPDAAPDQIQPQLEEVLRDARLRSGRLYYPLEALSFVPVLLPLVLPLLPRNSHAWMNKDDPSRPDFDFAYAAAVRRTEFEFQNIQRSLSPAQAALFTDLSKIANR